MIASYFLAGISLLILPFQPQTPEPEAPTPPSINEPNLGDSNESTENVTPSANSTDPIPETEPIEKTIFEFEATVFRQDGSRASGLIQLPQKGLEVYHVVDGIEYIKNIPLEQVRGLTVIRWQASKVNVSENQIGQYQFAPVEFEVSTRDGKMYRLKRALRYLNQFELQNQFGTSRFFSIFLDRWEYNGSGQLGWKVSQSTDFGFNQFYPNTQSIVRIEFSPKLPVEKTIYVPLSR